MIKGECNCGGVSFEINTTLEQVFICHCSICRRSTGGTGIAVIIVSNVNFTWLSGLEKTTTWKKPNHDWETSFCNVCGSALPGKNDETHMYVPVSLFCSGTEKLKVAHHLFVASKASWEEIGDQGKQHLGLMESESPNAPLSRQGVANDISTLIEIDQIARSSSERRDFIRDAVKNGRAWVVEISDDIIGYGVISHGFFGRSFIDLIYIAESLRSSGYGSKLLVFLEGKSKSKDLFTSTNESNSHIQHVLEKLGYERSGVIHNLDPGDPEIVYVKRSVHPQQIKLSNLYNPGFGL